MSKDFNEIRTKWIAKDFDLTLTELEQLRRYVEWAEESGVYYDRKDYFDKRHYRIRERLGMNLQPE